MGMLDSIKKFLGMGEKKEPTVQRDDSMEKSMLASQIVDLAGRIQKINSFDSSVWNIANASVYSLQRKSLSELQSMHAQLSGRLVELNRQSEQSSRRREDLEASKWTGQRPRGMTAQEFDRFQRDDER